MFLVIPHGLFELLVELLVELLERMTGRRVVGVLNKLFQEGIGELTIVCRALADGGRLCAGCDGLGGREFVFLGAPEGCDVLLFLELVLDEGGVRRSKGLFQCWRANIFPKSVPRSRMTGSKRIMVARSGPSPCAWTLPRIR